MIAHDKYFSVEKVPFYNKKFGTLATEVVSGSSNLMLYSLSALQTLVAATESLESGSG